MRRIADLIQVLDEFVELVLLQPDTHINSMVSRSIAMDLPSTGCLYARMFDVKVIPALRQGLCERRWRESDDHQRPEIHDKQEERTILR